MKKDTILKKKLENTLNCSGVYKMLDEKGNILYIGKSIALKKRIHSYFAKELNRNNKVKQMVKRIKDIEVYYTDTELDALLLECRWIRQYKPPYNTALMHPEKYSYFTATDECCILEWVKNKPMKEAFILGPMTHKSLVRGAYAYLKKRYPYAICSRKIGSCMDYVTGRCKGYCADNHYPSLTAQVIEELKNREIIEEQLTKQMERLADNWEFEKAKEVYEQLKGLKYMSKLYEMTTVIQEETYIGKLPIPDTFYYKYYLIKGGQIVATLKGVGAEEEEILKKLRRIGRLEHKVVLEVDKENIETIKIIYSFRKKKMKVFKV